MGATYHCEARLAVLASAVSAVMLGGQTVRAQESEDIADVLEQAAEASAEQVEEVVVTGTRIRRNDFTSSNPIATLTAEDMRDLGIVSVGDMLGQITSNAASATLDTTDGPFFVGAVQADLRGLNTAFGTRTLTLVDGRRVPSTTNGGGVDLSMVPSVLVSRMETVTGGAGATYGSDAMAGVVNVILDRSIDKTRIDAGYYTTAEGDGKQYNFSIAKGTRLFDGRGSVTFGFEHQTVDPILNCQTARDWCARSWNFIDNAAGNGLGPVPNDPRLWETLPPISNPAFPGLDWPRYQVLDDMRFIHSSPFGSLHTDNRNPADAFNGEFLEFTADGSDVVPYNTEADGLTGAMREFAYLYPNQRVQGGEGKLLSHGYALRSGSVRNNLYTRFDFEFPRGIEVNGTLSLNRNDGDRLQSRPGNMSETHCIHPDNAFIQPGYMSQSGRDAIAARAAPNGCTTAFGALTAPGTSVYKDWSEQIERTVETETEMGRIVLGANGGLFGGDNWTWDAYVQLGKTERVQVLENNRTADRYSMALDSVIDEVTGMPVCRVNSAQGQSARDAWRNYFQGRGGPDAANQPTAAEAMRKVDTLRASCVPLNPFGLAASPEALAYVYGDLIELTSTEQRMASVTFSGEIWDGFGAGPVSMAAGIDYREEDTENDNGGDPDPILRTDFQSQYSDPWAGGTEVADLFAEIEIPLLREKPAAEYMMINLANRRSRNTTFREYASDGESLEVKRYSDSYKVSWSWMPASWLGVRATRSADIRQPTARELFFRLTAQGGGGFVNQVPNPWRETNPTGDTWTTIRGSNPNLRNEESITETFGLVFTPGGRARGLQLAIDYVELMVKGGIAYAGAGDDPENEDGLPYTVWRCFQYEDPFYCSLIEFGPPAPSEPDNPRSDIISVMSTQENGQPYWTRSIDFSGRYTRRLRGGASISVRLLATRNLEQSICTELERTAGGDTSCLSRQDVVGQTGGRFGGGILANYSPLPSWSGNLFGTYRKGPLSITAQARYTGAAQASVFWVGPDDPKYQPESWFTLSRNELPSWTTWNTTLRYDLGLIGFASDRLDAIEVSFTIDNVFDRQPEFWSGGNIAGVNTRYYSGIGRSYRLGLQMEF